MLIDHLVMTGYHLLPNNAITLIRVGTSEVVYPVQDGEAKKNIPYPVAQIREYPNFTLKHGPLEPLKRFRETTATLSKTTLLISNYNVVELGCHIQ